MLQREKKVRLALSDFERKLLVNALMEFRNKLIANGKPPEDVNELLLKIIK